MVFADTSFWIALSSRRDQYHASALSWARHLTGSQDSLVTTEAVLREWLNALADSTTRTMAAAGYRRTHRDPRIDVVALEGRLIDLAVTTYQDRADKDWSLTDCLSFIVMAERQIGEALTSDHHFQQAGFRCPLRESPPAT
jgi:predicted nucleic acid-binding protein